MTNINLVKTNYEDTYEYRTYQITDGQSVIGFALVMYSEGDEVEAYCERIDIDENHRNAGHGTEALRALSSEFGDIYVAPDNEGAQRLYERLGCDASNCDVADYLDQGYGFYRI